MADKCHICLLGLIIICSLLTGTSGAEVTRVFSSSGENVRLPCNNALSDCTSTSWIYSRQSVTVELITGGKKKNNIERHERLSLGSDCSLNIEKVTKEDNGFYICRQYVNGEQQGADALVNLHVINVSLSISVSSSSSQTEIRPGSSVTLFCQLYYDRVSCDTLVRTEGVQLIWVNQAGVNLQTDSRYQISFSSGQCISTLTTTLLNEDHNREWRCLVTQRNELKTSVTYTVKYPSKHGEDDSLVFYRSGENVRLPCNNALSDCTSTTWIYSRRSETVELITLGIKKNDIERHERLSLDSDCSLNIKKATKEDYGFYICRQDVNGEQQGTDARVHLNVLQVSSSSSQTEIRPGSSVTLFCQLYYDGVSCDTLVRTEGVQLIWVNQAGVNLRTDSRYQISFSSGQCISTLTTTLLNEDHNREWRCLVTQRNELKTSVAYTVNYLGSNGAEDTHTFCSSGENVRLPCNNALSDCASTTWIYSRQSESVELTAGGEKKNNIERHERLSLGSDCSLNIKKVAEEDNGSYSCRQYVNGEQQGADARVYLHFLHVSLSSSQTEIRPGSSVTLSCQLYYDGVSCDYLVRTEGVQLIWVNRAGVNLQTDSRYQISPPGQCISTLTTTLLNKDHNREWRCLVTQRKVKTSVKYIVKYSAPVNLTRSSSNSEKKSSQTTAAAPTIQDPAGTKPETVSMTAGSLFRVIVIIVEIAVYAAPTVILLQIICARRAGET
ncbi:obscurin [Onychostoma macrolepis]|uniref:obscurin n=1 Tax=Onychostoma macrolepis TaxID=369639 RepID=UPI0027295015|nr:obscurin [Onychostoma macrolepis]